MRPFRVGNVASAERRRNYTLVWGGDIRWYEAESDGCRCGFGERLDGGGFVVVNIEDGVELGGFEQKQDVAGWLQELGVAALIAGAGQGANELADAGAVNVRDAGKVEDDLLLALLGQF